MILPGLIENRGKRKAIAWLIDPDKYDEKRIGVTLAGVRHHPPDFLLIGGSLIFKQVDRLIRCIRTYSDLPVILFPGSIIQLSSNADGILLLSLISGRNPDYLIGNHVIAAPFLHESGMEIISTGYMLVNGGSQTSVSYMSNTQPIPSNKPDIALATALAGEMLGFKMIYLDAGSGAVQRVSAEMISMVASEIRIPLMVGGGIRTPENVRDAFLAGADIVVVGTAVEEKPETLLSLIAERDRFNI
jgi:putative glycerol-1-phosphate prenyltransferase